MLATVFVPVAFFALSLAEVRFDGYKVYRVTPKSDEQLQALKHIETANEYSFWTSVSNLNVPVDIMVPPHLKEDFKDFLALTKTESKVFIENVQDAVDKSLPKMRGSFNQVGWKDYHTLEEIYEWLELLSKTHPQNVELLNIGKTYEGRDVKGVHVSFSSDNAKKAIFVEAGIHAREWISPATATFILNELLTSSNETIQKIAHSFDWYFFPVFNPDGYAYTFSEDRMWRKTRIPHADGCYGADPNRNWDVHWMETGASSHPCSEIYAGPSAFSENCTKVLSEYISTIANNLFGYISFHSYSQLLLIPYGHTTEHLDNYEELKAIGDKAVASLKERYGTDYVAGNIAEIIYLVSGDSMDWAKDKFGIRITYTYELRDSGEHGFLLPPDQIIPTSLETLDSFITIFQEALALPNQTTVTKK